MREIRQSGSEGGGGGASPYPYSGGRMPRRMAGTSPATTVAMGWRTDRHESPSARSCMRLTFRVMKRDNFSCRVRCYMSITSRRGASVARQSRKPANPVRAVQPRQTRRHVGIIGLWRRYSAHHRRSWAATPGFRRLDRHECRAQCRDFAEARVEWRHHARQHRPGRKEDRALARTNREARLRDQCCQLCR